MLQVTNLTWRLSVDKKGKVKEEAFFTILKLHGMDLSDKDQRVLQKRFSQGDKIMFKEALGAITVDLDHAVLNEEKWTVVEINGKPADL